MVGMIMLVVGVAIGFFIFSIYLSNLAQERQTTLSTQLKFQEGRTSYRNLFEVEDQFGVRLEDRLSSAVAADADQTFLGADKTLKTSNPHYDDSTCVPYIDSTTYAYSVFKDTYLSGYDVSEYNLRAYVKCYLIPVYFDPIFGENYKVTATLEVGADEIRTLTAGNPDYSGTGEEFYIAAPAGNYATLVKVTIAGAVE